ncbi:FAD:protein FMN transferase [Arthrobacter sp. S39]|uniref:FAD:protein FMN transferase n=1 Tax=Arthrobacter sp. S39 TaxID=2509720 RepID=UPI001F5EAA21|nr:FAD:protein FMN transferase [Arthrobacter sp. S39]
MPRISDAAAPRHLRTALKASTFRCMGTVISLTLPSGRAAKGTALEGHSTEGHLAEDELAATAAVVERLFRELDQTFSLYRPDSEASRLARGEITLRGASDAMRERYAEALEWRLRTEGAFTPERADGVLDLSGLIKGHAIREAGTSLLALGREDWCLNAGGDVLVSGSPVPGTGQPWQAGIVDPADRHTLLAGYPLGNGRRRRRALATSGSAERGDHIWSPAGAAPAFVQVSVAAADIVTADVLATAIIAGGLPMLDRATDGWDVDVLAVRADGTLLATPGFRGQGITAIAV